MAIKGVIFDFNGTMFPDGRYHEAAWRSYFASRTTRRLTDQDFRDHIHGVSPDLVLEYVLGRPPTPQELAAVEPEREEVYRHLASGEASPGSLVPGLPAFLDELRKRGVPMALATSSPLRNVEFYFDALEIGRWFDMEDVVYGDGTFPGKPNPDIFLLASARLGLPCRNCAVFEDAPSGIEAARRAGVGTIVGVYADLPEDSLKSLTGVSRTIPDYRDLDGLLSLLGLQC